MDKKSEILDIIKQLNDEKKNYILQKKRTKYNYKIKKYKIENQMKDYRKTLFRLKLYNSLDNENSDFIAIIIAIIVLIIFADKHIMASLIFILLSPIIILIKYIIKNKIKF